MNYRLMTHEDYNAVFEFWQDIEGISLSDSDTNYNTQSFLLQNDGLCFMCEENGEIIGTILCGNDGRRGYIHHLAVKFEYRNQGIGTILIDLSLSALSAIGIKKCHLFVLQKNGSAKAFYENIGWTKRDDIVLFSKDI